MLAIALLLAVLLGTATEALARSIVPGIVRGVVTQEMQLPADQLLQVDLGGGLLVPQLLTGRLRELTLTAPEVSLGDFSGAAVVDATGVALDGSSVERIAGRISLGVDQLSALAEHLDFPVESIAPEPPNLRFTGTLPAVNLSLGLSALIDVDGSDLVVTPVSVMIEGVSVDIAAAVNQLGVGTLGLADSHRVCVADRIPVGVRFTGAVVTTDNVDVEFRVDPAIVHDPALRTLGVC